MLIFDPLQPDSNGYSYNDIMIKPITKAAAAAMGAKRKCAAHKKLWFGMQGEVSGQRG